MTRLLDQIVAAHRGAELRWLDVPEWSDDPDKPVRVYWAPLTLAEGAPAHKVPREKELEAWAELVCKKALDKDGKRLFEDGDEIVLFRNTDGLALTRLWIAMNETEPEENFTPGSATTADAPDADSSSI